PAARSRVVSVAAELLNPSCLIAGREERGSGEIAVSYPYTGEQIGAAPSLPLELVQTTLDLAAAARVELDRYERSRVLERGAERLDSQAEALAELITWESGLCLKDTRHEVGRAANVFRAAAGESLRDDGRTFAGDIAPGGLARRAHTLREPVALVAAVAPFNHPPHQGAH